MRLVSLCTGYGGLDHAVAAIFPTELVAVSDIDAGANKILAYRYPDVPNLGDFTTYDWTGFECDIVTAGFPCQPVSHAGQRKGTSDERWLFDDIVDAVSRMGSRPGLLVFENVRGLLSANGGDAMARVVHGLASIGYVGRYRVLRASDVGAAHRRERVFIVAYPADSEGDSWRFGNGDGRLASNAESVGRVEGWPESAGLEGRSDAVERGASPDVALLPTPTVSDGNGAGAHGDGGLDLRTAISHKLLPTPAVADVQGGRKSRSGARSGELLLNGIASTNAWGDYAPAIQRWAEVTGRPAPQPTETSKTRSQILSPRFVEWLMGLPEGWVTDVPNMTRAAQLKALGNGVVPAQAEAALRDLLAVTP